MRCLSLLFLAVSITLAADEKAAREFLLKRASAPRPADGCSVTELTTGSVIDGSIDVSDCRQPDYYPDSIYSYRADAYRLSIKEDLIVRVDVKASDFEPDVFILNAAGELIATDITSLADRQAAFDIHLAPGSYTVIVSTLSPAIGPYRISAVGDVPHTCVIQNLKPGEDVTAAFETSDCRLIDLLPNGTDVTPLDAYNIEVTEKKTLTLNYSSTVVPGLVLLMDRNSGQLMTYSYRPGFDAGALASLQPGVYLVFVASANFRTGAYRINAALEDLRVCATPEMKPGEIGEGQLNNSDCRDLDLFVPSDETSITDPWMFEIKDKPAIVTLTMRSNTFDTFLGLADTSGRRLAFNDDFESTTVDSQIKVSLAPGQFFAMASHATNALGGYTLKYEVEPQRVCEVPELALGETAGALTLDDCRVIDAITGSVDQTNTDAYKLKVDRKGLYTLDLSSDVFRPALRIYGLNGALLYALTYSSNEKRSKFDILLNAGEYYLLVMTNNEPGAYRLSTTVQEPKACEVAGDLPLNGTLEGQLSSSDCTMTEALAGTPGASHVDVYRLELKEFRSLSVMVESAVFAPSMLLYDDRSAIIASGLNSTGAPGVLMRGDLPPGTYTIAILSTVAADGAYTVTTKATDSGPAPVQ